MVIKYALFGILGDVAEVTAINVYIIYVFALTTPEFMLLHSIL